MNTNTKQPNNFARTTLMSRLPNKPVSREAQGQSLVYAYSSTYMVRIMRYAFILPLGYDVECEPRKQYSRRCCGPRNGTPTGRGVCPPPAPLFLAHHRRRSQRPPALPPSPLSAHLNRLHHHRLYLYHRHNHHHHPHQGQRHHPEGPEHSTTRAGKPLRRRESRFHRPRQCPPEPTTGCPDWWPGNAATKRRGRTEKSKSSGQGRERQGREGRNGAMLVSERVGHLRCARLLLCCGEGGSARSR